MKSINQIKRNFGKIPLCNKKPERAPHIFGRCFFLCWRCTMVIIFTIISTIALYFFDLSVIMSKTFTTTGIILVLPMIFDGGIQYSDKKIVIILEE